MLSSFNLSHFDSQVDFATFRFDVGHCDQNSSNRDVVACDDKVLIFFICIFLGLTFGSDSVTDSVFFGLPPNFPSR